ncbi:MAG: hypothetical protein KAV45_11755, partial [Calditrichia bacterium]|nr:hypothetical protein [Calditrichia bacterium]
DSHAGRRISNLLANAKAQNAKSHPADAGCDFIFAFVASLPARLRRGVVVARNELFRIIIIDLDKDIYTTEK